MTSLLNKVAQKQLKNMVLSTYNKIEVNVGECHYNYKCHVNAVHHACVNGDDKIALTYYIHDGLPIIHFLNYHNGKYICNTLGHWIVSKDFYLVKYINKEDFFYVDNIFGIFRKETRRKLSFWVRLFSNQEF